MPCRQDLHLHFNTYFNSLTTSTDSSRCFTMKAVSAVIALTCLISFSTSYPNPSHGGSNPSSMSWACPWPKQIPREMPEDILTRDHKYHFSWLSLLLLTWRSGGSTLSSSRMFELLTLSLRLSPGTP